MGISDEDPNDKTRNFILYFIHLTGDCVALTQVQQCTLRCMSFSYVWMRPCNYITRTFSHWLLFSAEILSLNCHPAMEKNTTINCIMLMLLNAPQQKSMASSLQFVILCFKGFWIVFSGLQYISVIYSCVSVTAMVHQYYEPCRNVADWPNGSAAPRLSAEDSHQDCQSKSTTFFVSEPGSPTAVVMLIFSILN